MKRGGHHAAVHVEAHDAGPACRAACATSNRPALIVAIRCNYFDFENDTRAHSSCVHVRTARKGQRHRSRSWTDAAAAALHDSFLFSLTASACYTWTSALDARARKTRLLGVRGSVGHQKIVPTVSFFVDAFFSMLLSCEADWKRRTVLLLSVHIGKLVFQMSDARGEHETLST